MSLTDPVAWAHTLHIMAVIFWMAGLFMLPRYFAYHAEAQVGSDEDKAWQAREARLLRIIMNPAMIAAWVLGIWVAVDRGYLVGQGWLHTKLALVVVLTVFHMVLARWRKTFVAGENTRTTKFYRMVNEIPSFGIIFIVFLVEFKPF
ncbi:TIGR00701 family protein [Rhodothalassium salexigens]|uniref:protoporphyrinogen oxidase HemJ n=1 Tax=Rhodothalassium salexigens TaxID=1086 RepID=UPI0019145F76|nr:protoporphyrinogen oxidase HemJ [Rhodothalassium salexigens]MBK5911531.1 TIGR00701 family protein [Rhodothalassium salexigens]